MTKGHGQGVLKRKNYWPQVSMAANATADTGDSAISLPVHSYRRVKIQNCGGLSVITEAMTILNP